MSLRLCATSLNTKVASKFLTRRVLSTNVRRARPATTSVHERLSDLRSRLKDDESQEKLGLSSFLNEKKESKYESDLFTEKGRSFLRAAEIFNIKYDRGGQKGEGYVGVREVLETTKAGSPADHTDDVRDRELLRLGPDIQQQMRVKVSDAYMRHALEALPEGALEPSPILKVVLPDEREVLYREVGEVDPSNQNKYSPMPGLLHKYNMLLAMTSINCSSHCRYCYRSDLFNGSSGKSKADIAAVAQYVKAYNHRISDAKEEGACSLEPTFTTNLLRRLWRLLTYTLFQPAVLILLFYSDNRRVEFRDWHLCDEQR